MLLIEKYQTTQKTRNILLELNSINNNKERKMWLLDVINYILADTLKEEKQEIIKLILGGEDEMDEWLERVKRNDEKQRKGLIKQAKRNVEKKIMNQLIINMLKYQVTDEKIIQYTGIKQEQLEKIKNKTKNINNKMFQNS